MTNICGCPFEKLSRSSHWTKNCTRDHVSVVCARLCYPNVTPFVGERKRERERERESADLSVSRWSKNTEARKGRGKTKDVFCPSVNPCGIPSWDDPRFSDVTTFLFSSHVSATRSYVWRTNFVNYRVGIARFNDAA